MPEHFFPGFEFRELEADSFKTKFTFFPIREIFIPENIQTISLDNLDGDNDIEPAELAPGRWSPRQIKQEFFNHLRYLSKHIRRPRLTMRGRTFKFVKPKQMRPQTEAEERWLLERYGESMKDGGVGDCASHDDGTFTLRIGFAGEDKTVPREDVLRVMAHEYGHTLGEDLDADIFEELKASTFANLFMRGFNHGTINLGFVLNGSGVHDTAVFRLEQLLDQKIPEEAILAHLTKKPFGIYRPNDYLRFL